ncbi:MAG: hypothetical protein KY395_00235, partial [Actinobacteria bacterium]|nr:hypothetical protein [Actinomycetota bacterium]
MSSSRRLSVGTSAVSASAMRRSRRLVTNCGRGAGAGTARISETSSSRSAYDDSSARPWAASTR